MMTFDRRLGAVAVVALAAVASVAGACADGSAPAGIADGVPEDVLRAQERLDAGVPRAAIAHFFAADGSIGAIRSEGLYRPDPRTPSGERYIRENVRDLLSADDTELLLQRMRDGTHGPPGGNEYTWLKSEASPGVESSVPVDVWLRIRASRAPLRLGQPLEGSS